MTPSRTIVWTERARADLRNQSADRVDMMYTAPIRAPNSSLGNATECFRSWRALARNQFREALVDGGMKRGALFRAEVIAYVPSGRAMAPLGKSEGFSHAEMTIFNARVPSARSQIILKIESVAAG